METENENTNVITLEVTEIVGEEILYSEKQAKMIADKVKSLKENPDEEVQLDFSKVKKVGKEFSVALKNELGEINMLNLKAGKVDIDLESENSEKYINDVDSEAKQIADANFLRQVKSADKLTYVQSKVLVLTHPELLENQEIAEKFDWNDCSALVARHCPERIVSNKERFNWWKDSDVVKANAGELLAKRPELGEMLIRGKEREIRFQDDLHRDQIKLIAEEGSKFGLSSALVAKFKAISEEGGTISGQEAIELLGKDLYRADKFSRSSVSIDNDFTGALKVLDDMGLNVNTNTINKVRLNESAYLKLPVLDLSFNELKDQLDSLMMGEKSGLMSSLNDNGELMDYKLKIGYDPESGQIKMNQFVKNKDIKWPGLITEEEKEKLLQGIASIRLDGNAVSNYMAGRQIGAAIHNAIKDKWVWLTLDRDLNKVFATAVIPASAIKEDMAEHKLRALDRHVENEALEVGIETNTEIVKNEVEIEGLTSAELENAQMEMEIAIENLSIENKGEIEAPTEQHRQNYQKEERNIAGQSIQKVENLKSQGNQVVFKTETKEKTTVKTTVNQKISKK